MARKDQVLEIEALDAMLIAQRTELERIGHQRMEELRQVHSFWLIAGGVCAGVLVQRASTMGNVLSRLGSTLVAGVRLWPLVSGTGVVVSDPIE